MSKDSPATSTNATQPPTGAQMLAGAMLTATIGAQAKLINALGHGAVNGYRPSIFSVLTAPKIFVGAPPLVKVASLATMGTVAIVHKVGNVPTLMQTGDHLAQKFGLPSQESALSYMRERVEKLWSKAPSSNTSTPKS